MTDQRRTVRYGHRDYPEPMTDQPTPQTEAGRAFISTFEADHPRDNVQEYRKTATVLAGQAPTGGVIPTLEGDHTYEAGDYIAGPGAAGEYWPVRRDIFEATYTPAAHVAEASDTALEAGPIEPSWLHDKLDVHDHTRDCDCLPIRVVVDQHGHYWRDYGDHWSMCPVSDENVATDPVTEFYRFGEGGDMDTDAAQARTEALDVERWERAMRHVGTNRGPGEPTEGRDFGMEIELGYALNALLTEAATFGVGLDAVNRRDLQRIFDASVPIEARQPSDRFRCGQCGDDLLPEDIAGHMASEGRKPVAWEADRPITRRRTEAEVAADELRRQLTDMTEARDVLAALLAERETQP